MEREQQGEYIPIFARFCLTIGFGNPADIRRTFALAIEERTPPLTLLNAHIERLRSDSEIDSMHRKYLDCRCEFQWIGKRLLSSANSFEAIRPVASQLQ